MLKPIVSMNTMAMNESIATTCCYVWNGTSIAGSASLPHGGQLFQAKSTKYYFPKSDMQVSSAWMNLPLVAKEAEMVTSNAALPYKSAGLWYDNANNLVADEVGHQIFDDRYAFGNPKTYYTAYTTPGNMMHTGATSAHANVTFGNAWLADHQAYQFAS